MPLLSLKPIGSSATMGIWRMDEQAADAPQLFAEASLHYASLARCREYACVRLLLQRITGTPAPAISHNADGKPLLSNGHHISISHTRGYCAVVVSPSVEVAVDIEYTSHRVERILSRFLRADEQAPTLTSQLLHWSAKETVYKYFSAQKLAFGEMRVEPFAESGAGEMLVSNLHSRQQVAVGYAVTPQYVFTFLAP